jgi:hypothetical protein
MSGHQDASPYVEPGLAEAAAAVRAPSPGQDARSWQRQDAAGNWLPRDQQPLVAEMADRALSRITTVCESCEMVCGHAPTCTMRPPRGFWASPVQGADYLRDLIAESSSAALAEPLENVPSAFLLRGVNGEPLLVVHVMVVGQ